MEDARVKNDYIRVFKAFSDENRIKVLELLCSGEQCACVLLADLHISQPTLSHHMKILCESGIVKSRREGKWNYYTIDPDGCEYAGKLLNRVLKRNIGGLLEFARYAHRVLSGLKEKARLLDLTRVTPLKVRVARSHTAVSD
jgi:ArsR family transcriptional regulator